MKRILLLIIVLLNTKVCKGQSDYVVFTDHSTFSELIMIYKILPKSARPTALSDSEFTLAKEISKEYIEEYNVKVKEVYKKSVEGRQNVKMYQIRNLKNYKIQYVPYLNEKGEKEIWINGFCNDFNMEWRKKIIQVFDGGNCYFTIRLNLTTGKRLGIGTNGYS